MFTLLFPTDFIKLTLTRIALLQLTSFDRMGSYRLRAVKTSKFPGQHFSESCSK